MVFEGNPIQPKSTPKATTPSIKITTPPPTIPPPPAPKKQSHFFRNFLIYTIGLTAIAYAGGVYYSLEDDSFRDTFTENAPFAEDLVYMIEEQRFKRKFSDSLPSVKTSPTSGASTITSSKTTSTASRAGTPAAWTSAETSSSASPNAPKPAAKKVEAPAAPVAPAAPSAYKPTTTSVLPLIRVPSDADAAVAKSIEGLNNFITVVNQSKASPKDVENLSNEIYALANTIDSIKASAKAELEKKAAAVGSIAKSEKNLESTVSEMKTALHAQEEKWAREYHEETKRLTQAHNDRLQAEVEARSKVIFAHANNQLLAIHVAREKEFADQISSRIEKERDGRLSKLKDLASQVSEVQELAAKAGSVIEQSDRAAKLQLAVTRLRIALDSDEPIPLAPYFDSLKKLVNTPLSNSSSDSDKNSSDDNDAEFLKAVLDSVPKDALTQGVLSPAQLVARFQLLEPELRSASLVPPNAGILGHFGSLVFSKLLWKKSGNPQGDDIEAVLSRANTALSEGRVTDAVAEVNSLKGWPKKLAGDWLAEGRKRSELEFLTELLTEDGKLYY